jgi:hypothetical protein
MRITRTTTTILGLSPERSSMLEPSLVFKRGVRAVVGWQK